MNVPDYWWDNTVTTEQTDAEGNVISAKNSSGKVIGALVELEARKVNLSKYDENDAALFDNMSDQYSASRTYDVGDICIYDNKLYKCVTAVATAEAFDQTKWNKTSFAALHANQEKKISENTQSLTQLKNPAKGTKGILVNGGTPLTKDYLLVYTLKTTNVALSGASFSLNGIKVGDLVTRTPNNIIEICGCVRAFKGDIITTHVANAGGYADVYAYTPNTI